MKTVLISVTRFKPGLHGAKDEYHLMFVNPNHIQFMEDSDREEYLTTMVIAGRDFDFHVKESIHAINKKISET